MSDIEDYLSDKNNNDSDSGSDSGSGSDNESEFQNRYKDILSSTKTLNSNINAKKLKYNLGIDNDDDDYDTEDFADNDDYNEDDVDDDVYGGSGGGGGAKTKKTVGQKKSLIDADVGDDEAGDDGDDEDGAGDEDDVDDDDADDDDADDDDEDYEDEDEYFKKLSTDINRKELENYHPESKSLNFHEIEILSTVVRNNDGIIIDPLHKSLPILTKYEKTRILGIRTKQLENGAKPFINVPDDTPILDLHLIAKMELEQHKIPLIIARPFPNGGAEYWKVKDLEILD